MYGALAKKMQSNDLISPKPTIPFPDTNYKQLAQKVLEFESPQWTLLNSYYSGYGSSYRHKCLECSFASLFDSLDDRFELVVCEMVESRLKGGWIDSFDVAIEVWDETLLTDAEFLKVLVRIQLTAKPIQISPLFRISRVAIIVKLECQRQSQTKASQAYQLHHVRLSIYFYLKY